MLIPSSSYATLCQNFRWQIPPFFNIGVAVTDAQAAIHPNRTALVHINALGEETYSFLQMSRLSNQTANMLHAHGIGAGNTVAILLPQLPEVGYCHAALYKLHAIAVPLFTLFGEEALEYRLRDSQAIAVITDSLGCSKLANLRDKLPQLKIVFNIDQGAESFSSKDASWVVQDFHVQRAKAHDQYTAPPTPAELPAFIIYTSGTTGQPKGALHAHRALLGHLPGVEMSHDFFPQPSDKIWTPADWAWIGGLYDVLMPAWFHGITVVSHRFEKFDPEAAIYLIAKHQIRNAFLPPTALKMMRSMPQKPKQNLSMRSIASGGESLGAEMLAWGRETFGLSINEFYGQTECNMIVSSCGAIMETLAGKIGRAVPGHQVAIVDEQGKVLPPDSLGAIAVSRPDPVMFLGYWNNPQATHDKFVGDWLITGDQGRMNADGYIEFFGRDDDVIKSAGYRIGPSEIENCLLGHPAVASAAVIGVPDPLRNQIVKAYVVLKPDIEESAALAQALQNHVKERLSAHEYPRSLVFVAQLPLTNTGKVMRRILRQWHEEKKL